MLLILAIWYFSKFCFTFSFLACNMVFIISEIRNYRSEQPEASALCVIILPLMFSRCSYTVLGPGYPKSVGGL